MLQCNRLKVHILQCVRNVIKNWLIEDHPDLNSETDAKERFAEIH